MTNREPDLRVLVVAPTGRDGALIRDHLGSQGIFSLVLPTSVSARMEAAQGAGAVILAEEALTFAEINAWAKQMTDQLSWSDLLLVLLTVAGEGDQQNHRKILAGQLLGNVVLLERPVRPETFLTTIQAALRSRGRQYQLRDRMEQLRVAEEALRKSEKLAVAGRLAASIAHEINNPLAAVTNLLYLMGLSSSLEEVKLFTVTAASELSRVSEIVTQTLRFYRDPAKPVSVQVTDIVDSALTLYQARLSAAEITIERDFRECAPIVALAGEIRQLILVLIGNALDAMGRDGTLKIRVSNAHEHWNGSRAGVRLTIADTGSGINPEVRDTLFEPFVTTKGDTGTGLGLWVSSEIVHKHGGTIQVKSRTGASSTGTAFSVFLPLEPRWHPADGAQDVRDYGREIEEFLT